MNPLFVYLLVAFSAFSAYGSKCEYQSPYSPNVFADPHKPYDHVEPSSNAYRLSTLRQALHDCAEYLEIPSHTVDRLIANKFVTRREDLKCLIRCAGIALHWYDDKVGALGPVIESYFKQSHSNSHARVKHCLRSKNLSHIKSKCARAYESFQCYNTRYGVFRDYVEYVPLSEIEAVQAAVDCIRVQRVPKKLVQQYSKGHIVKSPETACLYRCQYLAEGLYEQATGFNYTRLYVRDRFHPDRRYFSKNVQRCANAILSNRRVNSCERVYQATQQCFGNIGDKKRTQLILTIAAKVSLGETNVIPDPSNPIDGGVIDPLDDGVDEIPDDGNNYGIDDGIIDGIDDGNDDGEYNPSDDGKVDPSEDPEDDTYDPLDENDGENHGDEYVEDPEHRPCEDVSGIIYNL